MHGRKAFYQGFGASAGLSEVANGRALTGQSHDYKRHGTTTLFAALEVATGKIVAAHSRQLRCVEFLDFRNNVTAAFPDRQLHVILDLNTTRKMNIGSRPTPMCNFISRRQALLAQVEVWFSILQGRSLSGAS